MKSDLPLSTHKLTLTKYVFVKLSFVFIYLQYTNSNNIIISQVKDLCKII